MGRSRGPAPGRAREGTVAVGGISDFLDRPFDRSKAYAGEQIDIRRHIRSDGMPREPLFSRPIARMGDPLPRTGQCHRLRHPGPAVLASQSHCQARTGTRRAGSKARSIPLGLPPSRPRSTQSATLPWQTCLTGWSLLPSKPASRPKADDAPTKVVTINFKLVSPLTPSPPARPSGAPVPWPKPAASTKP